MDGMLYPYQISGGKQFLVSEIILMINLALRKGVSDGVGVCDLTMCIGVGYATRMSMNIIYSIQYVMVRRFIVLSMIVSKTSANLSIYI